MDEVNQSAEVATPSLARTRFFIAAAITGIVLVVEIIGGLLSGSLALLADAAFMLVDFVALVTACLATGWASRDVDDRQESIHRRIPVLTAFANGVILLVLCALIALFAIVRIAAEPIIVNGKLMLTVAAVGLVANLVCYIVLLTSKHKDAYMRGAIEHVTNDLLGSLAVLAAAVAIIFSSLGVPGFAALYADPILAICFAIVMLLNAKKAIVASSKELIEVVPEKIEADSSSII